MLSRTTTRRCLVLPFHLTRVKVQRWDGERGRTRITVTVTTFRLLRAERTATFCPLSIADIRNDGLLSRKLSVLYCSY